ncbi:hypothetical protein AS19_16260 [Alcanivorax sp. NBRC 101098]|jgi:hypothetical protein|uniref:DUF2066 domain-containing protein n=1 Tax=Alcanivorax TaxID=59753 RepID=UPI0004ABDA79|nr:DUF2066 domain-containing protein [Alcanivorax sp. NBRC 101098]BAP14477.1 hypothetical protein AS19_16260 [Alcanivorax sp. NBRC 101098]
MRWIGLLAVLLGWSVLAQAQSLDTVQVPVDGRGEAQRQDALAQGLEQMLVRLSGQRDVLDESVASEAATQLDRWVTRYDYSNLEDGRSALQARYDVNGLMAFMADRGASVWSMPRSRVLLWLVNQGAGRGEMVVEDHPLYAHLIAEAQRRGLTLVIPEWDNQDQERLNVADVRGRFDQQLHDASSRYPHELIAAAVLYQGEPATVNWRVLKDKTVLEEGREKTANSEDAVTALIDNVTDQLAERYGVKGEMTDLRTLLVVDEVDQLQDWFALQQFLGGLSGMRRASLEQVSATTLTFRLDFSASDEQLRNLLELSPRLQACPDAVVSGPQWHYCWR